MAEMQDGRRGFYSQRVPSGPVVDRDSFIVEHCRGRRVVHVGCSDSPITAERLASGTLLHSALIRTASSVLGVDIDKAATDLLRDSVGGQYVIADASTEAGAAAIARREPPEIVVASDVLEHVPNAGAFLSGLRSVAAIGESCGVLISTPNGLAPRASVSAVLIGVEPNHPDHRALYTPSTLTQALLSAGLKPVEWAYYMAPGDYRGARKLMDVSLRMLARLRHGVGDGMVVLAVPV